MQTPRADLSGNLPFDSNILRNLISANPLRNFRRYTSRPIDHSFDPPHNINTDRGLTIHDPHTVTVISPDVPAGLTKLSAESIDRYNLFFESPVRIDAHCKIECGEGVWLGKHVHIASYCHLNVGGGTLYMEEGSSAGSGCRIVTGSSVPGVGRSCSAIAPGVKVKRFMVVIGKNATLYVGVTVLPGVTIGDGAVIAANSLVNRDVPAGEQWAGVPARKIKTVGDETAGSETVEIYGPDDSGSSSDFDRKALCVCGHEYHKHCGQVVGRVCDGDDLLVSGPCYCSMFRPQRLRERPSNAFRSPTPAFTSTPTPAPAPTRPDWVDAWSEFWGHPPQTGDDK